MPNKLPKFLDNHKICIICEGNEEYEYLKRLKDLKVWNEQYDISLVNAGGNGNIPARYQDRYQNGADELVLVFCDTEKKPHAAKFDKVFKYLQSGDEDEQVKYYEFLTEEEFNSLHRDDFLEVLVTSRFSKMKELTDSVMKVADLAKVIQIITDEEILDKKAKEAVDGFSALGQLREGKEISCVFNFEDGKYPLVAYLDQSYFRCSEDNFVGESYLLCKIIRKVQKGQSVKLDEIFGDVKKLPLNREQRRKMPKNMDNPKEIKDVVKGPALIVIPIAVYQ